MSLASGIYFVDLGTNKVQRSDINGSGLEDLVTSGINNPFGIAVDRIEEKMYWADNGNDTIKKADLDGNNIETIIDSSSGLVTPFGLALDHVAQKLYWADDGTNKIHRADTDGNNVEDLVTTGLSSPVGITLDIRRGKMYWTDFTSNTIKKANLDGSNVETIISTGLNNTNGIDIDPKNQKIYWVDTVTQKVQRANLDGSNVEDIVTSASGLSQPRGITVDVDDNKIYWSDGGSNKIQRSNLDGENVEDLITGLSEPRGVALDLPLVIKEDIGLFIQGPIQSSGTIDLVIKTNGDPSSGIMDLSISGPIEPSGNLNLYIGSSGSENTWPLFVKTEDNLISNSLDLRIHGGASGVNFITNEIGMFIQNEGDDVIDPPVFNQLWSMFLSAQSGINSDSNLWPLFLKAGFSDSNNINLSIFGHEGVGVGGLPVSGTHNLFIKNTFSSTPNNEDWPMFLRVTDGTQDQLNMAISGSPAIGTTITDSGDLFLDGHLNINEDIELNIFGISGIVNNNINLFINGTGVLNNDFDMYIHGFGGCV